MDKELRTDGVVAAFPMTEGTVPYRPNFYETKHYLSQVRDYTRQYELLEQRRDLRLHGADSSKDPDMKEIEEELQNLREAINGSKIDLTDLIAKLSNVDQQMVVTKRYVDLESWDQIAEEMGCTVRTVQKLHGKALPVLEDVVKQYGLERGFGISDCELIS